MVDEGRLRHDFYHRLNVVTIRVPSLNERREDIPALVEHYIREFSERYQRKVKGFDTVSMQRLCEANWKGNVRELRNTVERSVILSESPILTWSSSELNPPEEPQEVLPVNFSDKEFLSLEELEQGYINHVLKCCKGKKTKAARVLGIDKTTLWRKLRRYESGEEMV